MKKLRKTVRNSAEMHFFSLSQGHCQLMEKCIAQILCDKKLFFQTASYLCGKVATMKAYSRYFLSLVIAFALVSCSSFQYGNPCSDKLGELDITLEKSDDYVDAKEERISTIENLLHSRGVTELQQYHIYGQLYDEYVAFQFDKAKEMLEHQERIADSSGRDDLKNDALLKKAHLFTTAGLFLEAENIFHQLDTSVLDRGQMIAWYNARQKFLHDYQEYVRTSGITVDDMDMMAVYQQKILQSTPENSVLNRHMTIMQLITEEKYEEAFQTNLRFIRSLDRNSRDYAVQTYWQGFICENQDNMEEALHWWCESAMCDIRGAIKDNASLCTIAVNLTAPHDIGRAFRYIRISLDDALFYNAKLRKVQIASTLPWIEKAYAMGMAHQYKERTKYLLFSSLATLLLLVICVFSVRMYMKGRKSAEEIRSKNHQLAEYTRSIVSAEENLRRINMDLTEANAAKEEYLGLFLSMCSGYLDKLKKTLSRDDYEAELKSFYKTFDTSFLSLYPHFVEDFNALLNEDARITVRKGELLGTELRIYALIKLGITQSSHIASLLRYSVNTIYNYRAQIRNGAKDDKENFDDQVKNIGSRR